MKKAKFWCWISADLLLMFADGFLTFINTPDLTFEANPLVTKLGLGWGALAIANILTFALVFCLGYYSTVKYQTISTNETKVTTYWSQIIYDRPDKFWTGLVIKHFTPFIAMFGYVFLRVLPICRAIIVLEWIFHTFKIVIEPYEKLRSICFGRFDIVFCIALSLILCIVFMYKEFKAQLKK